MENKTPNKFIRRVIVTILLILGIYILYFLFIDTDEHLPRLQVMAWLSLLGLMGFFYQLFTKSGIEREKFWDIFFNGTGFSSEKDRREASKNLWILAVLLALGIMAVFFL